MQSVDVSTVFELLFSFSAGIINTHLLYLLMKKSDATTYLQLQWRTLGVSLTISHILITLCFLSFGILRMVFSDVVGSSTSESSALERAKIHLMTTSFFLVMVHNLCIMLSDYKYVILNDSLSEENFFYIVLSWSGTVFVAMMSFMEPTALKITNILCIIFAACGFFLIVVYIEINRRNLLQFRRSRRKKNEQQQTSRFQFLGSYLALSAFVFMIPFSFERLIWKQNGVVSTFCVIINTNTQGCICITRVLLKGSAPNYEVKV